eukprot:m.35176 g.35176  ORF g.35176 m.35176 type:complete len:116 (+) comp9991_c0_seq1:1032-1379(+)
MKWKQCELQVSINQSFDHSIIRPEVSQSPFFPFTYISDICNPPVDVEKGFSATPTRLGSLLDFFLSVFPKFLTSLLESIIFSSITRPHPTAAQTVSPFCSSITGGIVGCFGQTFC